MRDFLKDNEADPDPQIRQVVAKVRAQLAKRQHACSGMGALINPPTPFHTKEEMQAFLDRHPRPSSQAMFQVKAKVRKMMAEKDKEALEKTATA